MSSSEEINLMEIYTLSNSDKWNAWLTYCLKHHDIHNLKKVYKGIQISMNDLVKKKIADDKLNNFFLRIQRSIEQTLKRILREKYPNPLDRVGKNKVVDLEDHLKHLNNKRKRDQEFEAFLKDVRF